MRRLRTATSPHGFAGSRWRGPTTRMYGVALWVGLFAAPCHRYASLPAQQIRKNVARVYVGPPRGDALSDDEIRQPLPCPMPGASRVPVYVLARSARPLACAAALRAVRLVADGRAARLGVPAGDTLKVRAVVVTRNVYRVEGRPPSVPVVETALALSNHDYSLEIRFRDNAAPELSRAEPLTGLGRP